MRYFEVEFASMAILIFVFSLISSPVWASCSDAYRMLQDAWNHDDLALMVPGSKFLNRGEYVSFHAMGIGSGSPRDLIVALESIKNRTPSPERLELVERIERRYFRLTNDSELLEVLQKKPKHPLKKIERYRRLAPYHARVDAILAQAYLDETFCPRVHFKTDFEGEDHQGVFLREAVVHHTLKKLLEEDEEKVDFQGLNEKN